MEINKTKGYLSDEAIATGNALGELYRIGLSSLLRSTPGAGK